MDVPLLKIRRHRLPDLHLRVQLLYRAPRGIAYAFAVSMRGDEEQFELAAIAVNAYYRAADLLSVLPDPQRLAAVDGLLDGLA